MLKFRLLSVSLVVVCGTMLTCYAAAPVKVSTVAPAADLVAESTAKIDSLEKALASNDSYLQSKKNGIPMDAGVLAVLAQSIAESDESAAWKASAPAVRDAALKLAEAGSYEDAQKALASVKEAIGGKAGDAKVEYDWAKLCKLGKLMTEVNKRNGSIRKSLRKAGTEEQASRDASVLAVLAIAAHQDTHEVKNKADIPQWQAYALDMQTSMTQVAKDMKAKDLAAAKTAFSKSAKSCSDCHAKFRPE